MNIKFYFFGIFSIYTNKSGAIISPKETKKKNAMFFLSLVIQKQIIVIRETQHIIKMQHKSFIFICYHSKYILFFFWIEGQHLSCHLQRKNNRKEASESLIFDLHTELHWIIRNDHPEIEKNWFTYKEVYRWRNRSTLYNLIQCVVDIKMGEMISKKLGVSQVQNYPVK